MLCCVVLCCVVLCCVVLCCVVFSSSLFLTVQYSFDLILIFFSFFYRSLTVLFCSDFSVLFCFVLFCLVLFCSVLF